MNKDPASADVDFSRPVQELYMAGPVLLSSIEKLATTSISAIVVKFLGKYEGCQNTGCELTVVISEDDKTAIGVIVEDQQLPKGESFQAYTGKLKSGHIRLAYQKNVDFDRSYQELNKTITRLQQLGYDVAFGRLGSTEEIPAKDVSPLITQALEVIDSAHFSQ